jgi:hypothetical protein
MGLRIVLARHANRIAVWQIGPALFVADLYCDIQTSARETGARDGPPVTADEGRHDAQAKVATHQCKFSPPSARDKVFNACVRSSYCGRRQRQSREG